MKIKNKNSRFHFLSNKKVVIPILLIIVGLVCVAYVIYNNRNANNNSDNNRDDSAQTNNAKNDSATDSSKNTDTESSSTPVEADPEADQTPQPQGASVTMASYAQPNHQVTATVNVTGENSTSTCTFTFSHQDAKPVTRQVKASSKTCTTSIPEGEFNIIGLWQLNISLYNGSSKLAETNQNVTIN